ncbi:MAG: aminotransferase class I/II-fold pyridoxal phosphate-dependent enzyme [Thermoplasmata archaeon]|nr:aminotransferase class I/II-fold pyridoxal phosphate-dependent enzyme [Thermoplasmata archaeon]NIS11908.1 aminotransferase class I/II-fold pyridoxal phosphate-dependent enzyme [Thermoplasmata archaeon]NIS19809.1 aminotransferase class I/II-fold pyridoxal phosphate-dependent enzyme [Thermoplasmata archaeon]NIT77001.1 aminotransferase class I/II-fold pyridoxal phosphate-dependent enzyme [Thermoplasmata archaeon]NIU48919.1 aminotransferase class I/II-fold pyridoxal phosphate-dependent enzyme [T
MKKGISTRCVHAGEEPEPTTGAIGTPIFQNTTFLYPNPEPDAILGKRVGDYYIYTRYNNPTIEALEAKVADLEGGEGAVAFSSGMAAISTTLLTLAGEGGHIVSARDLYGGTYTLMGSILPKLGIEVTFVDTRDTDGFWKALRDDTRLVYCESITNPVLKVADIPELAEIAHGKEVPLVVDATFATPVNQSPLDLGADVVVHSGTKYLGGHGDVTGGVAVASDQVAHQIRDRMIFYGGCIDPAAAWLMMRGLKTMELRVARQNANARWLADWMESQDKVASVLYPELESHPDHEVAQRVLRGGGGMVTFDLGDLDACHRCLEGFQVITVAASLGGVESLVSLPVETSHWELDAEERASLGIYDGHVRLSVGVEDLTDLMSDLERGLERV